MIIQSVLLENFRSHKKYLFEPSLTGLTAISGENGAGKSSIVDAISWALYGIKPNGLKTKDLINDTADLDNGDKTRVTLKIQLHNKFYKIVRRIVTHKGAVECYVYSKNTHDEDWFRESGPGTSHADEYLRNLIGLDEKGFLSSVFVQQKQVDQIVMTSARERGLVIEKMLGIDSITNASQMAKDESRALQKALNIIQVGSLAEEKEKLEKQKELYKIIKKNLQSEKLKYEKIKKSYNNILEEYNKETEIQNWVKNIENVLNINQENKKILDRQLEQQLLLVKENRQSSKKDNSSAFLSKELKEKKSRVAELNSNFAINDVKLKNLHTLYSNKYDKEKILKSYKSVKSDIENIEQDLEKTKQRELEITTLAKSIKSFISLLKTGKGACEMCGKDIHNHKEEIEKNTQKLKDLEKEYKTVKKQLNDLNESFKEVEKEFSNLNLILENIKQQEKELDNYNILINDTDCIKKELENLNKEIKILEKTLVNIKAEEQNRELIEQAKTQIKETNLLIKANIKETEKLEKELKSKVYLSKSEYNKLFSELKELEKEKHQKEKDLLKIKHTFDLEKEKGENLYNEYLRCEKANEEYTNLSNQVNLFNLSHQTLVKFREERIKTAIPMLTNLASEILYKFTDGKFTQLKLTDKFDTFVVTNQNKERSISLLSGGEVSAVAIALRIAIALFLNTGKNNLLILDEVLVSMNEERAHLILETISNLTKSQIIVIAHNSIVNSFADKVVLI